MYLTLTGQGKNLALTASAVDKYAPHHTGASEVDIQRWPGPRCGNKAQQWWYDDATHSIHSMLHPEIDGVLFEGTSEAHNVVVFRNLKRKEQQWMYDASKNILVNDESEHLLGLGEDVLQPGTGVVARV